MERSGALTLLLLLVLPLAFAGERDEMFAEQERHHTSRDYRPGTVVRLQPSKILHVQALTPIQRGQTGIFPNGWNKGYARTPVPGDKCTNFFVAAYSDDQRVHYDCLKIRPTWMGDHRYDLEDVPLVALFLPPANNFLAGRGPAAEDAKLPLSLQGELWGQLVTGFRYFHFNLTTMINEKEHNPASRENLRRKAKADEHIIRSLLQTFIDIKEFIRKSPNEIIVLEIEGLRVKSEYVTLVHELVVSLYSVLGDYVIPLRYVFNETTFGDVWKAGRNVILAFNNDDLQSWFITEWTKIMDIRQSSLPIEGVQNFLHECFLHKSASNISKFINERVTAHEAIETPAGEIGTDAKWNHKYFFKFDDNTTIYIYLGYINEDVPAIACVDKSNNTVIRQYYGDGQC